MFKIKFYPSIPVTPVTNSRSSVVQFNPELFKKSFSQSGNLETHNQSQTGDKELRYTTMYFIEPNSSQTYFNHLYCNTLFRAVDCNELNCTEVQCIVCNCNALYQTDPVQRGTQCNTLCLFKVSSVQCTSYMKLC